MNCPSCENAFDDELRIPFTLGCLHTICSSCITRRAKKEKDGYWKYSCKLCGKKQTTAAINPQEMKQRTTVFNQEGYRNNQILEFNMRLNENTRKEVEKAMDQMRENLKNEVTVEVQEATINDMKSEIRKEIVDVFENKEKFIKCNYHNKDLICACINCKMYICDVCLI